MVEATRSGSRSTRSGLSWLGLSQGIWAPSPRTQLVVEGAKVEHKLNSVRVELVEATWSGLFGLTRAGVKLARSGSRILGLVTSLLLIDRFYLITENMLGSYFICSAVNESISEIKFVVFGCCWNCSTFRCLLHVLTY